MTSLCLALIRRVTTRTWMGHSRLESKELTLNREKCIFSVPELVFFGFKISANVLAPDDKKVEEVRNARTPQNAAEVRSFLGLVNYCAHFIPLFATLTEPLRKLTRSNTEWIWGEIEQDAFDCLRVALTSDCVVAHYDQTADTELKVDASPVRVVQYCRLESIGKWVLPIRSIRSICEMEISYFRSERCSFPLDCCISLARLREISP